MTPEQWDAWRAGRPRPADRVVVGYLHGGQVDHCFAESLINMYQLDQQRGVGRLAGEFWRISVQSGVCITLNRNRLVRKFLLHDEEPEWLLMVDTDMRWPSESLELMLEHAEPDRIIGGLCFAQGDRGLAHPTIFFRDDRGFNQIAQPGFKIPRNTLLQVHGTGAAFLLAHRDALTRIAETMPESLAPMFREMEVHFDNPGYVEGGEDAHRFPKLPYWIHEDLFFCDQIQRAGLTLWIDTRVKVDHRKSFYLNAEVFESDTSALEWA